MPISTPRVSVGLTLVRRGFYGPYRSDARARAKKALATKSRARYE